MGANLAVSAAVVLLRGTSSLPDAKRSVAASRFAFTRACHLLTSFRVSSYLQTHKAGHKTAFSKMQQQTCIHWMVAMWR